MSAKTLTRAHNAVIKMGTGITYDQMFATLQGKMQGEIVKIDQRKLPQGVIETIDVEFIDDSVVRTSLFIANDGTSKTSLRTID